jgi:hypothetical protein
MTKRTDYSDADSSLDAAEHDNDIYEMARIVVEEVMDENLGEGLIDEIDWVESRHERVGYLTTSVRAAREPLFALLNGTLEGAGLRRRF